MISDVHSRALRSIVIDALTTGVPATVQEIPAERIVWVGRNVAAPDLPFCALQVIGAEMLGLDGERSNAANEDEDALVQTIRTEFDVTVSITLATREDEQAPSLLHNAWVLARRLLTRMHSSIAADTLSDAGTGIQRVTGIRDLSRYTGSQAETRVALDVVLRIAVVDTVEPGWIETVAGTGTLDLDGGSTLTVPFTGTDPEP